MLKTKYYTEALIIQRVFSKLNTLFIFCFINSMCSLDLRSLRANLREAKINIIALKLNTIKRFSINKNYYNNNIYLLTMSPKQKNNINKFKEQIHLLDCYFNNYKIDFKFLELNLLNFNIINLVLNKINFVIKIIINKILILKQLLKKKKQ